MRLILKFIIKLVSYLPSQGDMIANIRAGITELLRINPQAHHVLLVSSDIPCLTAEMVDWVVKTTMQTDEDAYYNVITRQVMEKRFPTSNRSYIKLKDVEVCGADMNVVATRLVTTNDEIWTKLVNARKNALKQAALLGFDTLFLLLLHAITLEAAVKKVTKRLNITGRAILCPYAEVGMDIDKPHQLELMRKDFKKRLKKSEQAGKPRSTRTASMVEKKAGEKSTRKAVKQPTGKPAKK